MKELITFSFFTLNCIFTNNRKILNSTTEIKSFLEILGVHIDNKLSFKANVSAILKKVYAKIGVLR